MLIREFTNKDRTIIENIEEKTPNPLKIKALLKAYGMGHEFVRFFGDNDGNVVIAVQDNNAYLYAKDQESAQYAVDFLQYCANTVILNLPVEMSGFKEYHGNSYINSNFSPIELPEVSNDIQTGYEILSQVFSDEVNVDTYVRWYTDMSHRVRHGVSVIYNYDCVSSATAYCQIEGDLLLVQLGTLNGGRGQGNAKKLINHIATQQQAKRIMLLSLNESSDEFYQKIGFVFLEKWYYYERI